MWRRRGGDGEREDISSGELVTNNVFLVTDEGLVQVVELLVHSVLVEGQHLTLGLGEEGADGWVDLSGDVAEGCEDGVALWGSGGGGHRARVLNERMRG